MHTGLYVGCPELRAVRVFGVVMGRTLSRLAGLDSMSYV